MITAAAASTKINLENLIASGARCVKPGNVYSISNYQVDYASTVPMIVKETGTSNLATSRGIEHVYCNGFII
jgi:hypothetical protein